MVIGIFGESCTGKSTLAQMLRERLGCPVVTGKDYLRLAKSESDAKVLFRQQLRDAMKRGDVVYVTAQREHLELLPEGAYRVLVTADLGTIKERFAHRMHGNLPAPVAAMLERTHGCFDGEKCHLHIISGQTDMEAACDSILDGIRRSHGDLGSV